MCRRLKFKRVERRDLRALRMFVRLRVRPAAVLVAPLMRSALSEPQPPKSLIRLKSEPRTVVTGVIGAPAVTGVVGAAPAMVELRFRLGRLKPAAQVPSSTPRKRASP